ncbi:MAG TPA: dephospho-CoA kinase [Tepidisphaeraceae bacterium]|jgi:dephospho-CoA kinase
MTTSATTRKPIIGVAGGIGAGKSFVAKFFEELGGLVLSADVHAREAYGRDDVKQMLRKWWGGDVFTSAGTVDRAKIAQRVFVEPDQRLRLEKLIHPLVIQRRNELMSQHANDPKVTAFIWDVPLLFETGSNQRCDAVLFVDAPEAERQRRVQTQRGWDLGEMLRREKAQWPLDKKREMSDYVISNAADADAVRNQVRDVFSRIVQESSKPS